MILLDNKINPLSLLDAELLESESDELEDDPEPELELQDDEVESSELVEAAGLSSNKGISNKFLIFRIQPNLSLSL